MIKINLLPAEKRKAERTPLPRFFLIVSTAAAATILLAYNAWIFLRIMRVKEDIKQQHVLLASLGPDVAKHDELVAKKTTLAGKVLEIESMVTRDVDFWRAINGVWEVIHAHPKVWIDDLKVLDARAAQAQIKTVDPEAKEIPPYAVTLRCHVLGDEVVEMTKFRKGLKDNVILQETLSTINFNVDWSVQRAVEAGSELVSLDFSVNLFGPTTPPQRRPPSAPGAPKGPSASAPGGEPK